MHYIDAIVEIFQYLPYPEVHNVYTNAKHIKHICDVHDVDVWKRLYTTILGELHVDTKCWRDEYFGMYSIVSTLTKDNNSYDGHKYITPVSMHILYLLPDHIRSVVMSDLIPNKFIDLWNLLKSIEGHAGYTLTEEIVRKAIERSDPLLTNIINCLIDNLVSECTLSDIPLPDGNVCCRLVPDPDGEDINTILYRQITFYDVYTHKHVKKYFDNIDIHTILYICVRNRLPPPAVTILREQIEGIDMSIYIKWDNYD